MADARKPNAGAAPLLIRERRELLAGGAETGAVGMLMVDADARIDYANPAVERMLGYDGGDCVGLSIDRIVHPDDIAILRSQVRSLTQTEPEGSHSELRYLQKSGAAIWVLASVSLAQSYGGATRVLVQAMDIDRQKRATDALIAGAARSEYALESSGQGVWDVDFIGGAIFHSRNWKIMRGIPPDSDVDLSTEEWLDRVHPDDRERLRNVSRTQETHSYEYRERHEDGHWVWILSRGKNIALKSDGTPSRAIGTDTDISSLKAVEAELAAERERLSVTLQAIGDGVISTDAKGRVTFMNPVAETMTGWGSAEAVGHPVESVFAIVNEISGEPARSPVAECIASEKTYDPHEDVALIGRQGDRRAIRDCAAPLRTPDGKIIGAVLVFQDITNARALQKELAHAAMHDALTGLPNRAAFERMLADAIDQARRQRREHALCFVDLDRFKTINDTAGHAAGDALLKKVALAITRACRPADFTARLGGDEFVVVLADCPIAGARMVAQQIIESIASVGFSWQGVTYDIGASVGIAAITREAPPPAELLRRADVACYAAKDSGRNRVSVYDGTLADDLAQAG